MKNNNVIKVISEKILCLIEQGKLEPWRRPWKLNHARNLSSGKFYVGVNSYLSCIGKYFLTFKQASEMHKQFDHWEKRGNRKYPVDAKGNILTPCKGAKSHPIAYTDSCYVIDTGDLVGLEKERYARSRLDELEQVLNREFKYFTFRLNDKEYDLLREKYHELFLEIKEIQFLKLYHVFNIDDLDKAGEYERFIKPEWEQDNKEKLPKDEQEVQAVRECIKVVKEYPIPKPLLFIKDSNRAYYSPAEDKIVCPKAGQFENIFQYYCTLFHELGHSTGAAHRLNRKGIAEINTVDKQKYSYEELVADFTASMLSGVCGIPDDKYLSQSASYIAGWSKYLKEHKKDIYFAIKDAEKAVNYMLGKYKPQNKEV